MNKDATETTTQNTEQGTNKTPQESKDTPTQQTTFSIPIAILLAGVLIAGSVIISSGSQQPTSTGGGRILEAEVLPVTADDHVFGSRSADVFFIEYSDYRCGYCGLFHDTIRQILDTYDGKIAWVYRHTPFQPGGYEAAHASECIAELAGEDAFWKYTELALKNQKELGTEWTLKTAKELGADEGAFTACMDSDRYKELITTHLSNMQDIGGAGTPFSVIMTRNGDMVKVSGAQPLESVVLAVERALKSL